jgi:hypothetical protein
MASQPSHQACDGTGGTPELGGHVAGRTCKQTPVDKKEERKIEQEEKRERK